MFRVKKRPNEFSFYSFKSWSFFFKLKCLIFSNLAKDKFRKFPINDKHNDTKIICPIESGHNFTTILLVYSAQVFVWWEFIPDGQNINWTLNIFKIWLLKWTSVFNVVERAQSFLTVPIYFIERCRRRTRLVTIWWERTPELQLVDGYLPLWRVWRQPHTVGWRCQQGLATDTYRRFHAWEKEEERQNQWKVPENRFL